jgi:8-oxo-dGTP pyrophosphatase MutT (NUDIX family)
LELETLWQGKWISVVSPVDSPYEAVHEGDIVLVIPYLEDMGMYVIRSEKCPPYSIKDTSGEERYYTLISGKVEEGESTIDAALRETEEEAGIVIEKCKKIMLAKNIPLCKSTDMRATIFFLSIEKYDEIEAKGDGTIYEEESEFIYVTEKEIKRIVEREENYDFLLLYLSALLEGETNE